MTPTSRLAGGGLEQQIHGVTPLPTGARLGDFEVTGVIRKGEFGIVYAGADHSLPRQVAIKEYLPARLADRMADGNVGVRSLRHQQSFRNGMQGFLSEARMLAALDEPALVKVLRFWEQHGTAYLAMPLYEGRTLKDVLRDSPRPSEAWLKSMLGPLLDALERLHRSGCYPCDVTPDNIIVLDDGTPLLFDFGTVRRSIASSTEAVALLLDPGFAPIEQYAHDPSMPEGPWTDIYSVATVLHLAITGKPPPAPTTRIVSDTMPPLRDVAKDYSAMFLDAVDRGLTVRPEDRPKTIAEFRTALGIPPIAPGAIPMGHPPPSPPTPSTAARRVSRLPEPGPVPRIGSQKDTGARVQGAGPKVTQPSSPMPEQGSPLLLSQATTGSRLSGAPWKLVVPWFVVGLTALALLAWNLGGPRQATRGTGDYSQSMKLAPPSAQPSTTAATSAPPTETAMPPAASGEIAPARENSPQAATTSAESRPSFPTPPVPASGGQLVAGTSAPDANLPLPPKLGVARPASPRRAAPGGKPVTSGPRGVAASARSAPPTPKTGKVGFSIKPWGQIIVDGKKRGLSPPIKELSISEGRHRIEIRNSTFPGYASEVNIKAGSKVTIAHSFRSP